VKKQKCYYIGFAEAAMNKYGYDKLRMSSSIAGGDANEAAAMAEDPNL